MGAEPLMANLDLRTRDGALRAPSTGGDRSGRRSGATSIGRLIGEETSTDAVGRRWRRGIASSKSGSIGGAEWDGKLRGAVTKLPPKRKFTEQQQRLGLPKSGERSIGTPRTRSMRSSRPGWTRRS